MRPVQLAKVAAQAEALRLRQLATRTATRVILGIVAAVFVIAALVCGHVALAIALSARFGPIEATLLVAGGDLVIAIVFGLIASLKGPGRIEREALELRRTAQAQITHSLSVAQLTLPLMRGMIGRSLWAVARGAFRRGRMGKRA